MKKLFFLVSVFCLQSTLCFAESCTAMPSCAELGYYRGTNIACGDDDSRYITCPYDPDYRKCVNYDCEEMGFIKDGLADLQTWCQNIIFCKKDKSYVLCGDIDGPSTVCVPRYCTAVAMPDNSRVTSSCIPQDIDCETYDEVPTAWECITGYHVSDDGTKCDKDCKPETCDGAVELPSNAHETAGCDRMSSNCKKGEHVTIAWACNDGYHLTDDGECELDCEEKTCGTGVSVPYGAHSTGSCQPQFKNCKKGTEIQTGWVCNDGYHLVDNNTACAQDCQKEDCPAQNYPYTASTPKPEHGSLIGECTPQDTDCNKGTKRYADFKCDSDYCKDGSLTCTHTSTCNGYVAGTTISNGELTGTKCTAVSGTTTTSCSRTDYYPDFTCNSGYCKSGTPGCTKTKTCTENAAPENARCTEYCASITGGTTQSCTTGTSVCVAWECISPYHLNADGTGCEKDPTCTPDTCDGAITVPNDPHAVGTNACIPTKADCSTEGTVYKGWDCKPGWHKNAAGTGCEEDESCVKECVENPAPANAAVISTCTPVGADCVPGTPVTETWACLPNFHLTSDNKCQADCQVKDDCPVVNKPNQNAHYIGSCKKVDRFCSEEYLPTGWECDGGYHKNDAGSACEEDCQVKDDCGDEVSLPDDEHAYKTDACYPRYKNCKYGDPVYKGWDCAYGWHKNAAGTGCEKDQTCTPDTCSGAVTVPNDLHAYGTSGCTPIDINCNTGTTVYRGWKCESGWHKNAAQTGCDEDCSVNDCPTSQYPYAYTTVSNGELTGECTPQSADCNEGTKRYADFKCNTGYCKDGSPACTKTKTCSGYTSDTAVSHGELTGTKCTAISGSRTSSCSRTDYYPDFKCDDGYCKSGTPGCTKTKTCTENAAPSNATCTSWCTAVSGTTTTSCTTGTEVCEAWSCNTGYCKSGSTCDSVSDGCDSTYTLTSQPSSNSESCTIVSRNASGNCATSHKYRCKSGYHLDGSTCVKDEDCSGYTQANGWYTSKPSGCYNEGSSETCGGTTYTNYTAMDTTCCGEVTLYGSSRTIQTILKSEWDSSQCKCVDKAKVGASPNFVTVGGCPGGTHTHVPGQQSNCWKASYYHCFETGLWCDGYLSEDDWIKTGNPGGTCGTGKRYSEEDCRCVDYGLVCDNSKGYYNVCPTGASCTTENGCQKTTGCGAGYMYATSNPTPFTYSTTDYASFYVGTTYKTCYKVNGCNSSFYGSVDASNTSSSVGNVFTATTVTSGSVSCKYASGCKKVSDYSYYASGYTGCPSGSTLATNGPTAGTGSTIRKCYMCQTSSSSSGGSTQTCGQKYTGADQYKYNGTTYCGFGMDNTYWDDTCCKTAYASQCRSIQNDDVNATTFPGSTSWLKDNCFVTNAATTVGGYPVGWTILINN